VPDSLLHLWPKQSSAPGWDDINLEGFSYDIGRNASRGYVPTGNPPVLTDEAFMGWLLMHEGVELLGQSGPGRGHLQGLRPSGSQRQGGSVRSCGQLRWQHRHRS
jgi:hypothetical protein